MDIKQQLELVKAERDKWKAVAEYRQKLIEKSELYRVGCEYCNDGEEMGYRQDSLKRTAYIYLDGHLLTADLYHDSMAVSVCYCPMCGKNLREDMPCG